MNNIKIAKEIIKVAKELVIAANAEYDEENEKWLLDHGFKRGLQNYLGINEGRFEWCVSLLLRMIQSLLALVLLSL